jgi:hypothetical protein
MQLRTERLGNSDFLSIGSLRAMEGFDDLLWSLPPLRCARECAGHG